MKKKLFVFDLDFTLWNTGNVWCDCTTPPYQWSNNILMDANKKQLFLYPETIEILEMLYNEGHILAVASRTNEPTWAIQLMQLFDIEKYFSYVEIYPSSKIKHLNKISKTSGVHFSDIIFFDDEHRNITDTKSLGVNSIYVENGINKKLIIPYM